MVKKRVNVVENKGYHDDTNPTVEFFIDTAEQGSNSEDWVQVITVNNMERQFKLDTGAELNILPVREFDKLQPTPKLNSAGVKLTAYGSTPIPVIGRCVTKINYKANTHSVHFITVPKNVQPLTGVKTCDKLGLVKRVYRDQTNDSNNSQTNSSYYKVMQNYADVFKGSGCLPREHTIVIDTQASPSANPCPLQRMENLGVITRVGLRTH